MTCQVPISKSKDRPRLRLVATLKHVPAPLSRPFPDLAKDGEQLFYASDKVGLRDLKQKMQVIAHEHPGMDFPAMARTDLDEPEKKRPSVVVGHEHGIAAVAGGHHVVNRSRIFKPGLPSEVEN